MALHVFSELPLVIQVHIVAALTAFIVGGYVLAARKGDRRHRTAGWVFFSAISVTAVSSFFIHTLENIGIRLFGVLGPFSPIHILSVYVLWSMFAAIRAARRGDIARHRSLMRGMYAGAMIVAGAFTLLPGRVMEKMLLDGSHPALGLLAILAFFGFAAFGYMRSGRRPQSMQH